MLETTSTRESARGEYAKEINVQKYGNMPCVFSEDEMDDEIRMSELSGTVTHEEVLENLKGRARYENRLE